MYKPGNVITSLKREVEFDRGRHHRARLGFILMSTVFGAEADFLHHKGFEVLDIQGLNLETGIEFGTVTPDYWKQFAIEIDRPDADAIFLSCGGIRALEVVEEIEELTNKPVITSNQAQMWSC